MKLVSSKYNIKIEFKENSINNLILENKIYLRNIIDDFINILKGEEGEFVLSKNNNILDIKNEIKLILNPFNLDFKDNKILNRIYKDMEEIGNESKNIKETREILNNLIEYLEIIISEIDYPLNYEMDIDFKKIFKVFNLEIQLGDSFLEKILDYITIYRDIFKVNIFIFLNLKTYLTKEEYIEFYNYICQKKIFILNIETNQNKERYKWENTKIIDEDLCEI